MGARMIPRIPWVMPLAVLLAVLICETNAIYCSIGQEPEPQTGKYHWVIPIENPCECTQLGIGGLNTITPRRPFNVTYYSNLMLSNDPVEIRQWLNCTDKCLDDPVPFGIENGINSNIAMTASTGFDEYHGASAGRLNGPDCWRPESNTAGSWIQVDLGRTTIVTGVITQGCPRENRYVTMYEVDYQTSPSVTYYSVRDNNGDVKVFQGNNDKNTPVTNMFPGTIRATAVRIKPTAWEGDGVGLRLELLGCLELRCTKLGLEDRSIPDNRISASSSYNSNYSPSVARLNNIYSWIPTLDDSNPWIKVDLGKKTAVSGIITQGRNCRECWRVSKYKVAYETETSDLLPVYVLDGHGSEKVFSGNIDDARTPVTNMFPKTILATVVRIEPIEWPHTYPALRFELLSCKDVQ